MTVSLAQGGGFLLVDSDGVKVVSAAGEKNNDREINADNAAGRLPVSTVICKMQIDRFSETYRHWKTPRTSS